MLFLCWCDCGRLSVVACVFQRWSVSRVSALAAYTWSSLLITHLCRVELVTPQLCSSPSLMLDLCPARGTKALVISWFLFVLGLSFASFAQTPAAVRSLRGEKCKKHEEREECCVDEPASPCITHPQESTTDCSCSSLENTLVTSVCKEIKTNKYMFYDVICLCWVFDILLKWPYRWATTLGQTWNHRLHFLKTHCFSWNCYRWPMSATFVRTIQASVCLWSPQWTWKGAIVWGKRFSENFIKYKLCFGQADLLCSPVRRGISREQVFWVFLRINRKTNITLHTHSKAAQKPQQSPYLCILFLPRVFCSQRGSALISSTDLFTPLLCFRLVQLSMAE